ncbi:MAG: efflux RND transporter periplasmic adaptor subunit [Deltaproteobacteria bacterium]|nr:efflux RND transporter periplasmic adaptor subunit [Deltaproteobacteria bacterium]
MRILFGACAALPLSVCSSMLLVLAVSGCKKPLEPAEATPGASTQLTHADERAHEGLPKLVRLTAEVTRDAGVRAEAVRRRTLPVTVDLNGQLVANPDATALVGARTSGRLIRVLVREGDRVSAGQAIAELSSPEVGKLRGELAAATARATATRRNADRLRELLQLQLTSEQEALAAGSEASAQEAERVIVVRSLRGLGASPESGADPSLLTLTSPVAGTVVQLDAVRGQMVEPSRTLATVTDLSRVWFQAELFEKDLARVEEGAPAELRLNGYPGRVLNAKITRISGQVDPQSRTVTARLTLQESKLPLRLGLFGVARVSVRAEAGPPALVVPLAAIAELGDTKAVFVQQPDGDYQVHDVRLGASAGGEVTILTGLDEGEAVVVSGVHTLKSAVLKGTMAEDE